jgi:hypothetical protein
VPEEYVRLVREIEGWDAERGGFIDEEALDEDMDESADDQETPDAQDGGVSVGGILGGKGNGTGNTGASRDAIMTDAKSARNSTILAPTSATSTAAKQRSADRVS